jgi:molybdopterin-guanine dinucleotide biosynthesis protein A
VGIYRKSILPQLEKQIESGNYKMMKLLDSIKTQYVQAPFSHQFKNINTPADYDSIK